MAEMVVRVVRVVRAVRVVIVMWRYDAGMKAMVRSGVVPEDGGVMECFGDASRTDPVRRLP